MDYIQSETTRCILWAAPPSPIKKLRFHAFRKGPAPPRLLRMVSFSCNDPSTTAYSIFWNIRILGIHAHKPGEDLAFYKSAAPGKARVLWSYIPIYQDESISEIWKRSGWLDRELALVFKTTRGRVYLFGPQQRECWGSCTWTILDRPCSKQSVISYDKAEFGIHDLAFETPQPSLCSSHPIPLQALSPYPESTSQQDYFYSSAILDNVVTVAVCKQDSEERLSGLLFGYADGHEECVGEIRLDYLKPPIHISRPATIWLGFVSVHRGVHIRSIEFSRPQTKLPIVWFEVPICGLLEWWFSLYQCKVYHGGRASPATKL